MKLLLAHSINSTVILSKPELLLAFHSLTVVATSKYSGGNSSLSCTKNVCCRKTIFGFFL